MYTVTVEPVTYSGKGVYVYLVVNGKKERVSQITLMPNQDNDKEIFLEAKEMIEDYEFENLVKEKLGEYEIMEKGVRKL
jgi:hypothetical protein